MNRNSTDSDGDGIPDSVEAGADLSRPVDSDGDGMVDAMDADSDNDGMLDRDERIAGTSPVDAASLFRVARFAVSANRAKTSVYWNTVTGRIYKVYECTNLFAPAWTNTYQTPGTGGPVGFTNSITPPPKRFFRLGVELQ